MYGKGRANVKPLVGGGLRFGVGYGVGGLTQAVGGLRNIFEAVDTFLVCGYGKKRGFGSMEFDT